MTHRTLLKRTAQSVCMIAVFPAALACGFGSNWRIFALFAQSFALWPGAPGEYLRAAFYRLTLRNCSIDVVIAFGTFFSRPDACVEPNVSIGAYCVIGNARIGRRTQIASHVQIPSGRHQHLRDSEGKLTEETAESQVVIGEQCWIGSSAIVMADIGAGTTVGAGSVVVRELPPSVVAVGNPARVVKTSGEGPQ